MFGYADESGEPGVKKNERDYFAFCIVLFRNRDEAEKCREKIGTFRRRMGLPDNHEFHFAKDSKKTKASFIKLIRSLKFEFLSISIKKNTLKDTASFVRMANLTLGLLEEMHINATVVMDINPLLYGELRKNKKRYKNVLHIAERKSQSDDIIQVADYVVALRTRYIKYPTKTGVVEAYSTIAKKLAGAIEL